MARRVNTKFVVILSAALVGTVGIFGGVKYYRWSQAHNPVVVKASAETNEKNAEKTAIVANAMKADYDAYVKADPEDKQGKRKDLYEAWKAKHQESLDFYKKATASYSSAASLLSQKHMPGADAIFAQSADLCMKISREAQSQEDAVRYYQLALDNYSRALTENPLNKEVNHTLMEEDYQNSRYFPSTSAWKNLEEVTGKMIKTQDGAKPRHYRAEARLNLLQQSLQSATSMQSTTPASFAGIEADLDALQTFEPHSGEAVAMRAEVKWLQARLSASRRGLFKPEEFNSDERYMRDVADVRRMLVRCLQGKWGRQQNTPGWTWLARIPLDHVNADVANTLVTLTLEQYDLSGRKDASRLDAATSLLEAAVAADPDQTELVDRLGALYLVTGHAEKTEALFQRVINDAPENPEGYFRLAVYYRNRGLPLYPEAIGAYKAVTNHTLVGSGRAAILNVQYQLQAVEGIAWLSLELAERLPDKADHPKVEAEVLDFDGYMRQAAVATEKLRVTHAPKGMIELLDGRTQLISRDIPRALITLRAAEADLSTVGWLNERYRQTELMLARANEMQNQLGAALGFVNKALEIKPGDLMVTLKKGQYLLALAHYDEARRLMGKVLGETTDHKFANEKYLPEEYAKAAKSIWEAADIRLPDSKTVQLDLPGSSLQMAQVEIENNDFEAALNDAMLVLSKLDANSEGENTLAYRLVIECNLQLKRMEAARKYADEALAKFPKNYYLKVAKAKLYQPGNLDSFDTQIAIIDEAFADDPYMRAVNRSVFLHHKALANNRPGYVLTAKEIAESLDVLKEELKSLQVARELLKNASSPDERAKLGNVLDKQFTAHMTEAAQVADAGARNDYFNKAQTVVTDLEKLNLDGTDGKIYRGRLELVRTNGKNGLKFLQEAVSQRSDLAQAHLMLGQGYMAQAMSRDNGSAANTSNRALALDEFRQVIRLAPNNIAALQFAIELLVQKGDSSSMKEAEQLLLSGLAQAPHNSNFISYMEIFPEKVDQSIAKREALFKEQPEDRDNVRRLASLYVVRTHKQLELAQEWLLGVDSQDKANDAFENAAKAIDRAIELMRVDYKTHMDDKNGLYTADFLARLLVEYDQNPVFNSTMTPDQKQAVFSASIIKSADQAQEALQYYDRYINDSNNPNSKFAALIDKAEFCRKLALRPQVIVRLISAKVLGDEKLWEKAAGNKLTEEEVYNAPKETALEILGAAIKLEPEIDALIAAEAAKKGEQVPPLTDDAERHQADMYFDLDRMSDAEKMYEQVLNKKATKDMTVVSRRLIEVKLRLALLGEEDTRVAKLADVNSRLAGFLAGHPQDIQGLILRAYSSIQQGTLQPSPAEQQKFLKLALTDLNAVLTRDPANADALYYRATAQISLGDRLEEAANDLRQAAKLDKTKINSRVALAELFVRTQRYEEASREYREILKDHKELLNIRLEYTELLKSLAELQATLGKIDVDFAISLKTLDPAAKLIDEAKTAQDLYPNVPHWPFLYAQALSLQDKIAEAHRWFEFLYTSFPSEASYCDAYLGSLFKTKDYAKLVEVSSKVIDAAVKVDPETHTSFMAENPEFVSFFLKRAAAYQATGKTDQAVKDIDSALEIGVAAAAKSGKLGPFIAVLSEVVSRGVSQPEPIIKPELLAERLKKRVAQNPAETLTKLGLIQTLLLMNDNEGALEVVKDLPVPADNNKMMKFLVLSQTALVRLQNKRYSEAQKDYQELMTIAPNNVEILNNYAYMLAESGHAKEAIDHANRALMLLSTRADPSQLSASSANVYDTLGWAYYLNDDMKNAEENLRKSVKIQPQAAAYLHLALTLYKGKYNEEAAVNCQAGIDLATTRKDKETLDKLKDLQVKLDTKTVPAAIGVR